MILEKLEYCPLCEADYATQYEYDFQICNNCDPIPTIEEIEAGSFSTAQVAAMAKRIAELEAELPTLKAQREWVSVEVAELQPGEWVEAWHKVHECSITVTLGCGRETSSGHPEWWEKTLTTSWPFEAMSHVRPLPPAPEGS